MTSCIDSTPPWFVGRWRDWHRGHGCDQDDGKPRSDACVAEIAQHAANEATGFLTDAELGFLRVSTTSGNTMLVRALDELAVRRRMLTELSCQVDNISLTTRLSIVAWLQSADPSDFHPDPDKHEIARTCQLRIARQLLHKLGADHVMQGPPSYRCACGIEFDNYDALVEHVRLSIACPRCGAAPADLGTDALFRWACGHWIARDDLSAAIRTDDSSPKEP
jgi:DNA-directed RNA polymerase subunit RPC12/RpoP